MAVFIQYLPRKIIDLYLVEKLFLLVLAKLSEVSFKLPSVCQCHVLVKVNDVKAINGYSIKCF